VLGRLRRGSVGESSRAAAVRRLALIWTVLGLCAACSSPQQQVWSGPLLPGVSGSLSEALPDGVDHRVVNGIAWVSSESATDGSWLRQQIDLMEADELRSCLTGSGQSSKLLLAAAQARAEVASRTVSPLFPDPAVVESKGLWPEVGGDPERRWTTDERGAVERCRERNRALPSAQARAVDSSLRTSFEQLAKGRPDPVLSDAYQEFADCMSMRGYPDAEVRSPEAFVTWAVHHRSSADPTGRRVGADYVTCGAPVWHSIEQARAAIRLAFVSSHVDELRMLSSLVDPV
jgi:hypothetical protein